MPIEFVQKRRYGGFGDLFWQRFSNLAKALAPKLAIKKHKKPSEYNGEPDDFVPQNRLGFEPKSANRVEQQACDELPKQYEQEHVEQPDFWRNQSRAEYKERAQDAAQKLPPALCAQSLQNAQIQSPAAASNHKKAECADEEGDERRNERRRLERAPKRCVDGRLQRDPKPHTQSQQIIHHVSFIIVKSCVYYTAIDTQRIDVPQGKKRVLRAFSLLEVLLALLILGFVGYQVQSATTQIAILPTAPQLVTMRAEALLQKTAMTFDTSGALTLPAPEIFGDYTIQIHASPLPHHHYRLEARIMRENSMISVLFLVI